MTSTDSGSAPAVVLVNGLPWGLPTLKAALDEKYAVLSVQVHGWAEFDRGYSLQDMAADLAKPLNDSGFDRYSLVGVSFGAEVALWRALAEPEEVEALVLISPTCVLPTGAVADSTPEAMARLMLAHPEQIELPSMSELVRDQERELLRRLDTSSGAEDSLPGLRCATLVVFGQEDRLVLPEAARLYKELVPNCNISFVYDAGHAVPLERPEAVANLALDFLERRETFIVENRDWVINP